MCIFYTHLNTYTFKIKYKKKAEKEYQIIHGMSVFDSQLMQRIHIQLFTLTANFTTNNLLETKKNNRSNEMVIDWDF